MYCDVYNKPRGKIYNNITIERNVVNETKVFKVLALQRKLKPN